MKRVNILFLSGQWQDHHREAMALEAVITGTYKIELTTPTGLLSTNITAGEKKGLTLW
ncbi:MAG: hypothetical protein MZV63_32930 [Marinilabiliales bacterium]|nr:hypothetical protein [Marinilabiliales bacterium]